MSYWKDFKSTEEIASLLSQAINNDRPVSLIRVGDGENRYLSWETPFDFNEKDEWFHYAGLELSKEYKDKLLWGIKNSQIIGLEHKKKGNVFREMTVKVLNHYQLNPEIICRRDINKKLWESGHLFKLLQGKRIVLVGRKAKDSVQTFELEGINVVDYMGFEGFEDTYRVLEELKYSASFDVVLIAAGIPAVLLAPLITKKFQKTVIDIGHTIDLLVDPSFALQIERKEWFRKKKTCRGVLVGNYLVQDSINDDYYLLSNGEKYFVPSMEILRAYGLNEGDCWKKVEPSFLKHLPGENLVYPDGSLLQVLGNPKVFYVWQGMRYWIGGREYLENFFKGREIIKISQGNLELMPEGSKVTKPSPNDRTY